MENKLIDKLKKDIEQVGEWRKSGKELTREQSVFAEQVVDRMLAMKNLNKMGVHLISKDKLAFIQKYEPMFAGEGPVESGQADRDKAKRVSNGLADVAKASFKEPKQKEMPISSKEGKLPRKAPDAENTKLNPPKNQAEGEISAVADGGQAKEDAETKTQDGKPETELIGHNPNEPMPKKMAEDLMNNVKWGVEVGAYTTTSDGIDAQLTRKQYQEFIDTPEKLGDVKAYLKTIAGEQKDPKAQIGVAKAVQTKGQQILQANADKFNAPVQEGMGGTAEPGASVDEAGNPVEDAEQGTIRTELDEHREAQSKLSNKDYQDYLHARKQGLNHKNALAWSLKNDVPVEAKEDAKIEDKRFDEGGPGSGVYPRDKSQKEVDIQTERNIKEQGERDKLPSQKAKDVYDKLTRKSGWDASGSEISHEDAMRLALTHHANGTSGRSDEDYKKQSEESDRIQAQYEKDKAAGKFE